VKLLHREVKPAVSIVIPISEVEFSYARSSGPGGQNVNKTETKAVLRWNLDRATWIAPDAKARFRATFGTRITSGGDVVIHSDETRNRSMNEKACLEKLTDMLRRIWFAPKKRVATKPTRSSKRRRVESKRLRSEVKKSRQMSRGDDH
jgi:ribosome-associated protein